MRQLAPGAAVNAVKLMTSQPNHAFWVLVQQVAVRGLIALKFLLAARLLGPEQIGQVGIALLSLAIVEALSDTGLSQAVVQRHSTVNPKEAGAVWTLQMTRGIVLAMALLLLALPFAGFFKAPEAAGLVAIAAIIPLLRNTINPGVFFTQRDRNFRKLSIYEASAALVDLSATLLLIDLGFGAASLLLGNIASDGVKLFLSWAWLRTSIQPTFRWHQIRELTSYGKWIWGTSVITLLLNQFDKVLVAKLLGTTEFGLYQVASRIAQLVVADGAIALGQYLFPTFAKRFRTDRKSASDYLGWVLRRLIPLAGVIALFLAVMAGSIIDMALGPEWHKAVPVLQVMAISMFFGGTIAVLVAYFRAAGLPHVVTLAVSVQLLVLVVAGPLLVWNLGSVGMASASALALAAASAFLALKIKNGSR